MIFICILIDYTLFKRNYYQREALWRRIKLKLLNTAVRHKNLSIYRKCTLYVRILTYSSIKFEFNSILFSHETAENLICTVDCLHV